MNEKNEIYGIARCSTSKQAVEYETHYEYTESEWFEHKHEFDYDLEGNLDYEFSLNDVGQDVIVEFTVNLKNVNKSI